MNLSRSNREQILTPAASEISLLEEEHSEKAEIHSVLAARPWAIDVLADCRSLISGTLDEPLKQAPSVLAWVRLIDVIGQIDAIIGRHGVVTGPQCDITIDPLAHSLVVLLVSDKRQLEIRITDTGQWNAVQSGMSQEVHENSNSAERVSTAGPSGDWGHLAPALAWVLGVMA